VTGKLLNGDKKDAESAAQSLLSASSSSQRSISPSRSTLAVGEEITQASIDKVLVLLKL